MAKIQRIAPCLWFDNQAEEAAKFYTGIFKKSKIVSISRYSEAGFEIHRRPAGSVMVVAFELEGQPFSALNGGPIFKLNEAVSLQVYCETQDEIDYYWERSPTAAIRRRSSAAGSRTSTACHGRWCPPGWTRCSRTTSPPRPSG